MNPESVKQVIEALEKHGAPALDAIATNATYMAQGSLFNTLLMTLLCLGMWGISKRAYLKYTEVEKSSEDHDPYWFVSIICWVVSVIFTICTVIDIFNISDEIATLRNPRAAAVRILLGK